MSAANLALFALSVAGFGFTIWNEVPRGKVRGQAIGPLTKQPVANLKIALIDQDGKWHRARTQPNGQFEIEGLKQGEYRFLAQMRRWRDEGKVTVREAQTTVQDINLKWVPATIPLDQPYRDEAKVQKRIAEIVSARAFLTPELLRIIRDNNQSGLPFSIVLSQAGAESSFRPQLAGPVDEVGLFQLRPGTAQDVAGRMLTPAELRDPALSTRLGTRYLKQLRRYFGDTRTALGAYNLGPGRTEREGLYPIAQIYADGILGAAAHPSLKRRALELEPALQSEWQ